MPNGSCPGFPDASRRLHARNLLWTIDKGGSVEAMGLGNDDRPADAPRLSGVHDWKIGKLKPRRGYINGYAACDDRPG